MNALEIDGLLCGWVTVVCTAVQCAAQEVQIEKQDARLLGAHLLGKEMAHLSGTTDI